MCGSKMNIPRVCAAIGVVVISGIYVIWQDVLQSNPDAKVIMTVRSPDAWWDSMVASIHTKNPALGGWGE